MDLTVTTAVSDQGQCTISLDGALDLQSRTELLVAGQAALAGDGCSGLVLNLSDVNFIDSTGIGALVQLAGDATDRGVAFALQDPSPRVLRILEITGLRDAWTIDPG